MIKRFIIGGLTFILICAQLQVASAAVSKEHQVKVGFLYNFTKFVDWPNDTTQFNICVIGNGGFRNVLSAIEKKSSGQRTFKVHGGLVKDGDCHIIYFVDGAAAKLGTIKTKIAGTPALIVGDGEEFATKGGAIGFVKQKNKIKLVINPEAAKKNGLHIDSQLLEVALKVIK